MCASAVSRSLLMMMMSVTTGREASLLPATDTPLNSHPFPAQALSGRAIYHLPCTIGSPVLFSKLVPPDTLFRPELSRFHLPPAHGALKTIYSRKLNFQLKQISQNTFQYLRPGLLSLFLACRQTRRCSAQLSPQPSALSPQISDLRPRQPIKLPIEGNALRVPRNKCTVRCALRANSRMHGATGVTFFKLGNKFLISLLVVLPLRCCCRSRCRCRCRRAKDIFNKSLSSTSRNAKTPAHPRSVLSISI